MGSVEEKAGYSYHADATMKRVFFIPLYDSHIRVFMPLIKQLQAQNTTEPMVVFLERVHTEGLIRLLDGYSLPYIRVDLFPRSFKRGRKIYITDLRMRSMEKHMVTLFHTRKKIKGLFDSLDPAFIVVVNESYYADRFFLHEAKKRGIPSLSLFSVLPQPTLIQASPLKAGNTTLLHRTVRFVWQWFWFNALSLYRDILTAFGIPLYYIGAPSKGQATKVCVWSELVKQELVRGGGVAEKIVVTGSPGHDMIYHQDSYFGQETKEMVYELLNIEKGNEIILFTSQPFAEDGVCSFEEQRWLTKLVIDTCAKFHGYILIVKLHPRESLKNYGYIKQNPLPDRFRLVNDEDTYLWDLIYTSRLVITQSSTTGVDAILFDKDVINLNLIIKTQPDYAREGATINVYYEDELIGGIDRILNDKAIQANLKEARERFIQNNFPEFDGRATDRVMELVSQLMTG